jgi:hypothetical protein
MAGRLRHAKSGAWRFFQPWRGGVAFVAAQGLGWALYSISLVAFGAAFWCACQCACGVAALFISAAALPANPCESLRLRALRALPRRKRGLVAEGYDWLQLSAGVLPAGWPRRLAGLPRWAERFRHAAAATLAPAAPRAASCVR